jgi:hypothetical protein
MLKKILLFLCFVTPLVLGQATYKYFKYQPLARYTTNRVGDDTGQLEIELKDAGGTNLAVSIGGTVTGTGTDAVKAFDGSYASGNGWHVYLWDYDLFKNWVQIEFATAQTIYSYSVSSYYTTANPELRSIARWMIYGSNDGVNYDFIDYQEDQGPWTFAQIRSYTIDSDSIGIPINSLFSLSNSPCTGSGTLSSPWLIYDIFDWDSCIRIGSDSYYEINGDLDGTPLGHGMDANGDIYADINGHGHTVKNFYARYRSTPPYEIFKGVFLNHLGASTGINRTGSIDSLHFYNMKLHDDSPILYQAVGIIGIVQKEGSYIRNVTATKCTMIAQTSYSSVSSGMGVLVGDIDTGTEITECGVDSSYLQVKGQGKIAGGLVGYMNTSNFDANRNYSKHNTIIMNTNYNGDMFVGGLYGTVGNGSSGTEYDNYVYGNKIYDSTSGTGRTYIGQLVGYQNTYSIAGEYSGRMYAAKDSIFLGIKSIGYYNFLGGVDSTNWGVNGYAAKYIYIDSATTKPTALGMIGLGSLGPLLSLTEVTTKTTAEMKNVSTYTNWDFTSPNPIWTINPLIQNGYPFLTWENLAPITSLDILVPTVDTIYSAIDTIKIIFTSNVIDTAFFYYSDNNKFSWILFDSLAIIGDTTEFNWYNTGLSGEVYLKIGTRLGFKQESARFYIFGLYSLDILSPINSSATVKVGDTIDVVIKSTNIDSLNIYYAISDSINWIPIAKNIATNSIVDTMTFQWVLPNIHGSIWLKASNITDTATTFNKQVIGIGGGLPSQPAICWYSGSYYYSSWVWPSWALSPYAYCGVVDPTCGWGYYGAYRFSIIINDYATGYDFFKDSVWIGTTAGSVANGPYNPYSKYFTYTLTDSTAHDIGELFSVGDSITYKNRLYFVNTSDSTLRMNDLVHHVDSVFVADLKDTYKNYWYSGIPMIQNYNIQPSKLYNKYFPSYLNLETLNSPYFEPVILLSSSNKNTGRGNYTVKVVALSAPNPEPYTQDVVNIFTTLNMTRDYFRGIDPKARRHGR